MMNTIDNICEDDLTTEVIINTNINYCIEQCNEDMQFIFDSYECKNIGNIPDDLVEYSRTFIKENELELNLASIRKSIEKYMLAVCNYLKLDFKQKIKVQKYLDSDKYILETLFLENNLPSIKKCIPNQIKIIEEVNTYMLKVKNRKSEIKNYYHVPIDYTLYYFCLQVNKEEDLSISIPFIYSKKQILKFNETIDSVKNI